MKRLRAIVSGRVQGVYFRAHTQREAEQLGLTGYALNRADRCVEVVAEGDEPRLRALLEWLHRGPPQAQVTSVSSLWEPASGDFVGFEVRP